MIWRTRNAVNDSFRLGKFANCVFVTDDLNTLSVGIGGSRCAFVAYEIKPDGTLDGVWGGYGSDKTGTEKATKK